MQKLLIANRSSIMNQVLENRLQAAYDIYTCTDGREALAYLNQQHPDGMIINLSLRSTSGLEVLQNAGYTPRSIVVLTDFVNEAIIRDMSALGIQRIIRLPATVDYIVKQLQSASPAG